MIQQPIERVLKVAAEGEEGLRVLSQVVVIRPKNGIDQYLFRRATGEAANASLVYRDSSFNTAIATFKGQVFQFGMGDAFLPNFDDDGWPIDARDIDVLDISDWVTGYEFDQDINFSSSTLTLGIANQDMLFGDENIVYDATKYLTGTVYSGVQTPRNKITGQPVIYYPETNNPDYQFQFLPNYHLKDQTPSGSYDPEVPSTWPKVADEDVLSPLFRNNNIIKVREAYENPDWNAALAYDPNNTASHYLIWKDVYIGLVSAPSPSVAEGGRPGLTVTCHDFLKMSNRGTSERTYIPTLATNDATKDANGNLLDVNYPERGGYSVENPEFIKRNKIFYNPFQTSRAYEDYGLGMRPLNYQFVNEEHLKPIVGGKGFISPNLNTDWAANPDPQVFVGFQKVTGPDGSGEYQVQGTGLDAWTNGVIVRWYNTPEPGGRPIQVERWNGIYMCLDRKFNPNSSYVANKSFLANYHGWSMTLDTTVDLSKYVQEIDGSESILLALYVEGVADVYWDGQKVASVNSTLADYPAAITNEAQPVPMLQYSQLNSNYAIVKPNDGGIVAWTVDVMPQVDNKSVKLHHLRIVYKNDVQKLHRKILALRWWGETKEQRDWLRQNAASLIDGTLISSYWRNKGAWELILTNKLLPSQDGDHTKELIDRDIVMSTTVDITKPISVWNGSSYDRSKKVPYTVYTGSFNFIMSSNAYQSGYSYIEEKTDPDQPYYADSFAYSPANRSNIPDPQWYDEAVAFHYDNPVLGKALPKDNGLLKARIQVTKDDPDWGYDVLYTRGGIEFKIPFTGLGQVYTDASLNKYRFGAAAKYIYKAQLNSNTVDDILSDLIIEDGFGVDRYNRSFIGSGGAVEPAKELPLYTMMRYGWWEKYVNSILTDFGPMKADANGDPTPDASVITGIIPSGFNSSTQTLTGGVIYKPKVAIAQVQSVPDTFRIDLENAGSTQEAVKKVLDVLRSNFYVYANENGLIRGRFLEQDGLPRLQTPIKPAIQPDITKREFYCMTAVGHNMTLDLPRDQENEPPLVSERETTFSHEICLDRVTDVDGFAVENPYPNDTNINTERLVVFSPIFLKSSATDPNATSVNPRDISDRDKILYYWLYRRRWTDISGSKRWVWQRAKIECGALEDGIPITVANKVVPYTTYNPKRNFPSYKVFWVAYVDALTWESCGAPPSGTYDPKDLKLEPLNVGDTGTPVRPLLIGYDYKLEALQSIALPKDDFDVISRVQIIGERNGISNPELVDDGDTRIFFSFTTAGAAEKDNPYLPWKWRQQHDADDPRTRIKDAISGTSPHAGADNGFVLGWLIGPPKWSSLVNSCSAIYLVDEKHASEEGQRFNNEGSVFNPYGDHPELTVPGNVGCDDWPDNLFVKRYPGWWDGSGVWGSTTDLKETPWELNGMPWPKIGQKIRPARLPLTSTDYNFHSHYWKLGFWAPEGRALDFYYWESDNPLDNRQTLLDENGNFRTDIRQLKTLNEDCDRVRGGFVQGMRFDFAKTGSEYTKLSYPNDDRVMTPTTQVAQTQPNNNDYFELFSLDFGKQVEIGRIAIGVGYGPAKLEAMDYGMAKLYIDSGGARFYRWLGRVDAFAKGVRTVFYQVAGFADPTDPIGQYASRTVWGYNNAVHGGGTNPPSWNTNSVNFKVGFENCELNSVGPAAPVCEFFLQLEIGNVADTALDTSGYIKEDQKNLITWQVIATDYRVTTRTDMYAWGEDVFNNIVSKARFVRIKARQISPTLYAGFLTRTHSPSMLTRSSSATNLEIGGRLDFPWNDCTSLKRPFGQQVKGGAYELKLEKVTGYDRYKISWNGFSLGPNGEDYTFVSWTQFQEFRINGGEAGILKVKMITPEPPAAVASGPVIDMITITSYFAVQGDRNVGNYDPQYLGVNLLPSFGYKDSNTGRSNTEGTTGWYRYHPWFGALPPIYYNVGFVSITKLEIYQKKDLRTEAILRPDPMTQDPTCNEWYDPKLAAAALNKIPYRTIELPKRSKAKADRHGNKHLNFNHRSIMKRDPSSYTEGRGLSTGLDVLKAGKLPRSVAQVNVLYHPGLRAFQTVLVADDCVHGYVLKNPNDPNSYVSPFGRLFLIERINVSKQSAMPKVTLTLRSYH